MSKQVKKVIEKIEHAGNAVGNRFNKTVKALMQPKNFPLNVSKFIQQNGDEIIQEITIVRTPIQKAIKKILDVFGGGKDYDKLFHLRIQLKCQSGFSFTLEKNEVIKISKWRQDKNDETLKIPQQFNISVIDFINNGQNKMGQRYFTYNTSNNCQAFILGNLKANGVNNQQIFNFVKQNTESVFKQNPNLRKFSNSLTDVGGYADVVMQGGKIKNKWMNHVNEFRKKNSNLSYKECLIGAKKCYCK